MKKLRKRLFSMKMLSSLLIIGIFFLVPVFAAETSTSNIEYFGIVMNDLVSFLSWAWVFFAVLAGKLMTNDFVYGSFMNLDSFLWQMWNMMKNFANFTIGFMFLFYLIKSMFSREDSPMSFIKDKIVGFLIAGVLIQMSWFLVGAVLDISTIATSAVGAFPASMIEDKSSFQGDLRTELEKIRGMTITWDAQAASSEKLKTDKTKTPGALGDVASKEELNKYLDAILPNQDNLSGPLLFMGMSLFKFQDFTSLETIKSGDREKMFITGGIQLFLILIFTLAMFILFILNVARVVTLWMVIVFVPFLILFKALKIDIMDKLSLPSLTTIIKMIFAPVIFTAFMSIMLIFTFAVWGMLNPTQNRSLNEVTFIETVETSSIEIEGVATTTISGIKTGFADLLVYIMLIFLLWMFLKISIQMVGGNDGMVGKVIKPLMEGAAKLPSAVPLIPGKNGRITAGGIQKFGAERKAEITKNLGMDKYVQDQKDFINERLGLGQQWRSDWDTQLTSDIKNNKDSDFFTNSKLYVGKMNGVTLSGDSNWRPHVESFLRSYNGIAGLDKLGSDEKLETYFTDDRARIFAKQMGKTTGVDKDNIMTTAFGRK